MGFERPEPYEGKLSRTVLRGGWVSNGLFLPDELDLNEYCIQRRGSTYFVRAIGNSMTDIGLHSGDLMVVDKAEPARHGDIIIAEIDGEFTVKRLLLTPRPGLQPMNPAYPTLWPEPEQLQIFGVVTAFVHKTRGAQ
ncbi:translesion error-prone DNA polymerase V autoproteolytic subunit [Cronobacter sakazakii]|nr:translesion error-prone DNA polymerase V autoproteolytic subunit [Citrobacter freundii]EKK5171274.1 translesion error-prone DNA polymerase V autoproteolytic subunit [Cronobacter sakazakii]EKV5657421.1 translesion error-prone DNA polymerase V autoproteolytic subunit [Citrobacter farmeri]QLV16909.1 translesion error-prone DNA polymerase V autoproteolytic subunit [Enterobacter roggenkampii]HBM0953165.1 translesion error-prone DNA polymerase V autoproteolytic subunit [Enterobacter kobei]